MAGQWTFLALAIIVAIATRRSISKHRRQLRLTAASIVGASMVGALFYARWLDASLVPGCAVAAVAVAVAYAVWGSILYSRAACTRSLGRQLRTAHLAALNIVILGAFSCVGTCSGLRSFETLAPFALRAYLGSVMLVSSGLALLLVLGSPCRQGAETGETLLNSKTKSGDKL